MTADHTYARIIRAAWRASGLTVAELADAAGIGYRRAYRLAGQDSELKAPGLRDLLLATNALELEPRSLLEAPALIYTSALLLGEPPGEELDELPERERDPELLLLMLRRVDPTWPAHSAAQHDADEALLRYVVELRKAREAAGVSRRKLAEAVGRTSQWLTILEGGGYIDPPLDLLHRMTPYVHRNLADLFFPGRET